MTAPTRALDLAPEARRDIAAILAASEADFGPIARRRYRLLIEAAFADLQADPARAGVRPVPEVAPDLHLYALRHSRKRAAAADRVRRPAHAVAFRVDPHHVLILRVLDERMDLPARLRERP